MADFKKDTDKWKRRAMAFAVRAHNHLWGKNNENPLVFLYQQGLSHDFCRQMYLGWNKFGQERPFSNWGIQREGKFFIPPGIVFPYIIGKELTALFILPMDTGEKGREVVFSFPGNPGNPIVLGHPDQPVKETKSLIDGLKLFQDKPDRFCIKILG